MATTPVFAAQDILGVGQVSAANTNRDGTGTLVTLLTGSGSAKQRVYSVRIKATVTTTAGMIRLFLSTDGGTNKRMIAERVVSAITVGAAVAAFEDTIYLDNGVPLLDANAILYASTHNAEAMNLFAIGAQF